MFNRPADALFQLIKSLSKSEKRNFKLFARRNVSTDDLKTIQLFDALDKMPDYNEAILLKKNKQISKSQLSNLKAQVYRQVLNSLRMIRDDKNIVQQLHEYMDHARTLYYKGLYLQSLKILDKLKELAQLYHQTSYIQQAIFFEKKIEALYITRSIQDRAETLGKQSEAVLKKLAVVNKLSTLSLELYSWYISNGHARNQKDLSDLKVFFQQQLPAEQNVLSGFYEQLYLHQSNAWYAFIRLEFVHYYRHCLHWTACFDKEPRMLGVETAIYIKGMHNLMSGAFTLGLQPQLAANIKKFEQFVRQKVVRQNQSSLLLSYQYLYTARINEHFLSGKFTEGLYMVPFLEKMLQTYGIYLDAYRVLVFYYKIACLYFGSGENNKAIHYLNLIINSKGNLRSDLQCYARLLHLIAHYELGNFRLLEYLTISVYRFMAKMENLSKVDQAIFDFLKKSFTVGAAGIKPEFEHLLERLKGYANNPLEARSFTYLDFISWLESKIEGVHVEDIIRRKVRVGRGK